MSKADQIAEEWQAHRIMRENYRIPDRLSGIHSSEIVDQWQPHISFESFVFNDTSIGADEKRQIRNDAGRKIPRTSTEDLIRFTHPMGYQYFKKNTSAAKEEWFLSQFAHACDFPYAPVLLGDEINDLYTPKLGHNLTSLYGFLINALKRGDDNIPDVLKNSFNRAVQEFGQPNKIPYKELLDVQDFAAVSDEHKAYLAWLKPFVERETVFISKLVALGAVVDTQEPYSNPTNIIVNPQTGRFIYAIDTRPINIVNKVHEREVGTPFIGLDAHSDPDIVRDMQRIMREKITDEFIDDLVDCLVARIADEFGADSIEGIRYYRKLGVQYGQKIKQELNNPAEAREVSNPLYMGYNL